MDYENLRTVIRRKLDDGGLPLDRPDKLSMRYGSRAPCNACGDTLHPGQAEYDLIYASDRPTYRLHLGCAGLWEAMRLMRGLPPTF
jgi:hypothetical protein